MSHRYRAGSPSLAKLGESGQLYLVRYTGAVLVENTETQNSTVLGRC
jgi:hypothetical protein